jgi:hypothetical protein
MEGIVLCSLVLPSMDIEPGRGEVVSDAMDSAIAVNV